MSLQGILSAFMGDGLYLPLKYIFLLFFTLAILFIYLSTMVDTYVGPKAKHPVVDDGH